MFLLNLTIDVVFLYQCGGEVVEVDNLTQLFPRDFLKLSCGSLEGVCDTPFRIEGGNPLDLNEFDEELEIDANLGGFGRLIRLHKDSRQRPVYGIDTSNIGLGKTEEGILWAFRGSIVRRENETYRYIRHGPFIFHVTEGNKLMLYNTIRRLYFDVGGWVSAPILERIGDHIREALERLLQKKVCLSDRGAIIL